jgi:hypothetical protein
LYLRVAAQDDLRRSLAVNVRCPETERTFLLRIREERCLEDLPLLREGCFLRHFALLPAIASWGCYLFPCPDRMAYFTEIAPGMKGRTAMVLGAS